MFVCTRQSIVSHDSIILLLFIFRIQQSFGLFTTPGSYDEQDYHALPPDAQSQPYLEGSPEFYASLIDQKYGPQYLKNSYRGKCIAILTAFRYIECFMRVYKSMKLSFKKVKKNGREEKNTYMCLR